MGFHTCRNPEPRVRFELTTYCLQDSCSSHLELTGQINCSTMRTQDWI
jgi:hypothetical protein